MGPVIGGGVLVAAGVLLVAFRERAARWNRRELRRSFGRLAAQVVRNSTPSRMVLTGLIWISIGIWLVIVRPGS